MKLRHTIAAATIAVIAGGVSHAATLIYFDDFNDQQNRNSGGAYTQTLAGSTPTIRSGTLGGSSSATWLAGVETNGWGQRDYGDGNVATPTSSNFLAFTPDITQIYTVQMTVDTTPLVGADPGGTSSWFAVGFTSSQHNWNGVDVSTIDTADLVRFYSNTVTTITYTVSGADLAAAGVQYVGWITDHAGVVNLDPNNQQVRIDNFSLTAVPEPGATLLGSLAALALLRRRR